MSKHAEDMPPPCRLAFAQLVQGPEVAIDLAQAALLIAKEEYPDLDVVVCLARLDAMGEEVQRLADGSLDPHRLIAALNEHLFQQLGFRGNP